LEPGTEAQHLGLVHGGLPTGALRDERVADLGATCIYAHDDETERSVLDRYPSARPLPMQGLMVRSALARSSDGAVMVLHRGHHTVEVSVAKANRLLLSNTYPARTSQDLLYFALLAAEGSGTKASEIHVHRGGTHFTEHEGDLLRRFFGKEECAVQVGTEASQAGVNAHRWLALLEQFACVS
ncbi:MAG TPA: DUF3822 family protein, partial [Flavobacteriales bacterium]|nr:DUF3822 family protein [Flavobacteriales bacterium]